MLTDPTSLTNSTVLSQEVSKGGTALGKDEFLKLLTTQLANQDPLEPMDNTEFVAQLAQFSSLEGITNLGTTLEQILNVSAADNAANAVTLIAKDVRYATNELVGPGEVFFQTAGKAEKVTVAIRDENGTVVHTVSGLKGTGNIQSVAIDGPTIHEGQYYTVEVAAEDAEGNALQTQVSRTSYVTGVTYDQTGAVLQLENGSAVSVGNVIDIRVPKTGETAAEASDSSEVNEPETDPNVGGEG